VPPSVVLTVTARDVQLLVAPELAKETLAPSIVPVTGPNGPPVAVKELLPCGCVNAIV
jgi:hypothetical protein